MCFNGFCLGPQRPLAVEQSSQTVLTLSTAIDTLNITTFFDKTSTIDAYETEEKFSNDFESKNTKPNFIEKFRMINPEEKNFQINNPDFAGATNTTMFSDSSAGDLPSPFIADSNDSQNNNHLLCSTSSQMDLMKSDVVDLLNNTVENIYINDCVDINMQEIETEAHLTAKEKDLIKVIQIKDVRIKDLEEQINRKDEEIANLKSHLDKFQSVFPFSRSGATAINQGRKIGRTIQRQRAQGISAEPQSESSMHDLLSVTFPKYDKEEP